MPGTRGVIISSLREAGMISIANVVFSGITTFLFGVGFVEMLGLVLLLEAVGLMTVAGVMDLSGTTSARKLSTVLFGTKTDWRNESRLANQQKAVAFAIAGILLFGESLLLALLVVTRP